MMMMNEKGGSETPHPTSTTTSTTTKTFHGSKHSFLRFHVGIVKKFLSPLKIMIELLVMRGYVIDSVAGVSDASLKALRRALRPHEADARTNHEDIVRIISSLDVNVDELYNCLPVVKQSVQPCVVAHVPHDVSPLRPCSVAGDLPGETVWVIMAQPNSLIMRERTRGRRTTTQDYCTGVNSDLARHIVTLPGIRRCIVVTPAKLHLQTRTILLKQHGPVAVELFTLSDLQLNAHRHVVTPRHEVVTPGYVRKVVGIKHVTSSASKKRGLRLPQTLTSDMAVRQWGLPEGTFLKIHIQGCFSPIDFELTEVTKPQVNDFHSLHVQHKRVMERFQLFRRCLRRCAEDHDDTHEPETKERGVDAAASSTCSSSPGEQNQPLHRNKTKGIPRMGGGRHCAACVQYALQHVLQEEQRLLQTSDKEEVEVEVEEDEHEKTN